MANPTAPASTPRPGHVYLKLAAGETYVLHNVPDVGTVHFTESAPVCPHPIPADFVRKLKLHEERVPKYNHEGEGRGSVPRFAISRTPWPAPKVETAAAPEDDADLLEHTPDAWLAEAAGETTADLVTADEPAVPAPTSAPAAVPATPEERGRPTRPNARGRVTSPEGA